MKRYQRFDTRAVPARRTVVSRNAPRPCGDNIRRPSRSVARPWQPCHRGRCHGCSRAWPQIQKMCCALSVGEGHNMMARRGRCACSLCEAVQDRSSSSARNEEETGTPGMHTVSSAVRMRCREGGCALYNAMLTKGWWSLTTVTARGLISDVGEYRTCGRPSPSRSLS
jgi:hypothetical protein